MPSRPVAASSGSWNSSPAASATPIAATPPHVPIRRMRVARRSRARGSVSPALRRASDCRRRQPGPPHLHPVQPRPVLCVEVERPRQEMDEVMTDLAWEGGQRGHQWLRRRRRTWRGERRQPGPILRSAIPGVPRSPGSAPRPESLGFGSRKARLVDEASGSSVGEVQRHRDGRRSGREPEHRE